VPRAGLTPQAVVELALAVVDDGGPSGWADLGLSAVAHRAGVAVPSLYKHVDGLPALRSAVAARCAEELTAAMGAALVGRPATPPRTTSGAGTTKGGGRSTPGPRGPGLAPVSADDEPDSSLTGPEAVRALADAVRAYALAHPGRYRAVQGAEATALGPGSAAPAELVAHVVGQLGLPPDRWVDQVRAVRAAVHGFVELELGGGFGMPEDVDASFRYLVETLVAGLRGAEAAVS
jgi:AcrR family transcriptional regulator